MNKNFIKKEEITEESKTKVFKIIYSNICGVLYTEKNTSCQDEVPEKLYMQLTFKTPKFIATIVYKINFFFMYGNVFCSGSSLPAVWVHSLVAGPCVTEVVWEGDLIEYS